MPSCCLRWVSSCESLLSLGLAQADRGLLEDVDELGQVGRKLVPVLFLELLDRSRKGPRVDRLLHDGAVAVRFQPLDELGLPLGNGRDVGLSLEVVELVPADEVLNLLGHHGLGELLVNPLNLGVNLLELVLQRGFPVPQLPQTVGQLKQRRTHATPLPPAMIWRHSSTTRRLMSRLAARACMMRSSTVPLASRWKYWTFSAVCPARWMRALACS